MADRSSHHPPSRPPDPGAAPYDDTADCPAGSSPVVDGNSSAQPVEKSEENQSPAGGGIQRIDTQQTVLSKRPPLGNLATNDKINPKEMGLSLQGQQLDHFQLGEFVGGGGMGAVFKATDAKLDRTVAVKILSRSQTDEDVLRRFRNEAQSAARLDHPNIARVYYVGEDQGWNYIVFEYIEGINVRDLVERDGPLPLENAINYTLQIAEALEHASQRDVVHRDIKPSNVLVMDDGRAKLVDMGLARLNQVEAAADDLTASGVTLGTFDYISPEQAYDPRSADVRSDLYSLGCTFYYMLTGRPPFPEGTVIQKLLSHTSEPAPDPRLYRPRLPEEVANLLGRLLAKQPERRFQQPSQLIGELLLLADHLGLERAAAGGRVWVTDARPSTFVRFIPILASLAALLAAIVILDNLLSDTSVSKWQRPQLQPALPSDRDAPSAIPTIKDDPGAVTKDSGGAKSPGATTSDNGQPTVKQPDPVTPVPGSGNTTVTDNGTSTTDNPKTGDGDNASTVSKNSQPGRANPSPVIGIGPPTDGLVDVPIDSPDQRIAPSDIEGEIAIFSADQNTDLPPANLPPSELHAVNTNLAGRSDAPVAAEEIRTFWVGTGLAGASPPTREIIAFTTLDAALKALKKYPRAETIELLFDGSQQRLTAPLEIADRVITIRAGRQSDGRRFTPQIMFAPQADDPLLQQRLIRIRSGSVLWEDIHFRLELPSDPLASPWALFDLDRVETLSLRRCTMTIRNEDEAQSQVAFFDVLPRRPPGQENEAAWSTPKIELENCLARGQATLVRAAGNNLNSAYRVSPFSLYWNQGLLATNRRLLTVGSSASKPEGGLERIDIHLEHVTAVVMDGLGLLQDHPEQPHLLPVKLQLDSCILLTHTRQPLFLHKVQQPSPELEASLSIAGSGNFFPGSNFIWRIDAVSGEDKEIEFNTFAQQWPQLVLPRRDVMWNPATEGKFHTFTKSDYLLNNDESNMAAKEGAGFSADSLPDAP